MLPFDMILTSRSQEHIKYIKAIVCVIIDETKALLLQV
jgi:hypothetical protein